MFYGIINGIKYTLGPTVHQLHGGIDSQFGNTLMRSIPSDTWRMDWPKVHV